jgi:hypothetical protein
MMSATPVPSYPLRRIARAATDTMRSCVASLAADRALGVVFRMTYIIRQFRRCSSARRTASSAARPIPIDPKIAASLDPDRQRDFILNWKTALVAGR